MPNKRMRFERFNGRGDKPYGFHHRSRLGVEKKFGYALEIG